MVTVLEEPQSRSIRLVVRDALEEIRSESPDRIVTAAAVVDKASNSDHPLHKHFEWDDSKAAEKYRLAQARQLIRVYVLMNNNDPKQRTIQAYVSLAGDRKREGGGYRKLEDVMGDKSLMAELRETFKKELDGFLSRYECLENLVAKVREVVGIKPTRKRRKHG